MMYAHSPVSLSWIILTQMIESYYLVAIIDNNYVESNLYDIFWELIEAGHAEDGHASHDEIDGKSESDF